MKLCSINQKKTAEGITDFMVDEGTSEPGSKYTETLTA